MLALRDNGRPGSFGYPELLRRVAITNGSLTGTNQPGVAGGTALQVDIALGFNRIFSPFRPLFFYRRPIRGAIAIADINFSPSNGTATVFRGQIDANIALLKKTSSSRRRYMQGTTGSYDLAPGGFYNAQQQIVDQSDNTFLGPRFKFKNVVPNHCFIPAVSAVGYQYQQMSSYQNSSNLPNPNINLKQANLICRQTTPFDAVYGLNGRNIEHIKGEDAGTQEFLYNELLNRTSAPLVAQSPINVCPGQNQSITLQAVCTEQATMYNWQLSYGLQFLDGSQQRTGTDIQQVVRAVSGYNGSTTITVTATRSGALTSLPLQISTQIGSIAPAGSVSQQYGGFVARLNTNDFTSLRSGQYLIVMDRYINYSFTGAQVQRLAPNQILFTMPTSQAVRLDITETNAAGCPESGAFYFYPTYYRYAVSPNPTSDDLVIEMEESATEANKAQNTTVFSTATNTQTNKTGKQEFLVEFYDNYGKLLTSQSSKEKKLKLNVRPYQTGLYNLRIICEENVQTKHIQIVH